MGVTIHDGVIDGDTSTGIHVGEPGKANADPDVTVTNVTISGAEHSALHGDIANESDFSLLKVTGTADADSLIASGNTDGALWIEGLGGVDTILGGSGSDLLAGGDGNDIIRGAAGFDLLYGGGDDDTFVFDFAEANNGTFERDDISDFLDGNDMINVTGGATVASVVQFGSDVIVTLDGDGDTIVVHNSVTTDVNTHLFIV